MAKKKARATKKTAKCSPKKARGHTRTSSVKAKEGARETTTSVSVSQETKPVEAGPESPVLNLAAIDALSAVTEQLIRVEQELAKDREARDQETQENKSAWASMYRAVLDVQQRMTRFEESQRQFVEDKSVAAEASRLRAAFAGACKVLNISGPTPAIIGRAMHDLKAFSSNAEVEIVPRKVFEGIYAKIAQGVPDHLSERVKTLLGEYESAKSGTIAKHLGGEFDRRFELVENMGLGEKQETRHGRKSKYRRVLIEWGARVFREWPDWNDATGGTSFAEPPQPPTTASDETALPSPVTPEGAANEGPPPSAGSIDAAP